MPGGKLSGNTAIVTGGASGIGFSIAAALSKEGANVVISDIVGEEQVNVVPNATFISHDMTKGLDSELCIGETLDCFGSLAILVNNAGVMSEMKTVEETSYEDWKRVMSVNIDSVFLGVKHVMGL